MHPNTPYTWLKRFCERHGLKFKGLHSFRHTVATQSIANGEDIKSVSAVLGHSNPGVTLNTYAHAVRKATVRTLNNWGNMIEKRKYN